MNVPTQLALTFIFISTTQVIPRRLESGINGESSLLTGENYVLCCAGHRMRSIKTAVVII